MKNNADNILNSLRETIWVLNNKEISVADFSDAFKNYCVKCLQNFEDINFEAEENIKSNKILTAAEAIHFDKILKEAFQNTIKHSRAGNIVFKVDSSSEKLQFTLSDNGEGFNINSRAKGNGIDNMQWRAKEALATLQLRSEPGKGSSVSISL
jgi:signal transduction histidine kinase